jgi:hypothetical protein
MPVDFTHATGMNSNNSGGKVAGNGKSKRNGLSLFRDRAEQRFSLPRMLQIHLTSLLVMLVTFQSLTAITLRIPAMKICFGVDAIH